MPANLKRRDFILGLSAMLASGPSLAKAASNVGPLYPANNLNDLNSLFTARTNLSVAPSVATRAAMAALTQSTDVDVYLAEAGRQGTFKFSGGNLSSQVTSDPNQGIYVAPAADPTGATGAWVRQYSRGFISVLWFGVTGDSTTNDRAAWQAAINFASGGSTTLWFPAGYTSNVVNATSSAGSTLVQKRANAVANGTLFALTSSATNLVFQIDGAITATSALDDLFRTSGDRNVFQGTGLLANTSGDFLDTNSTDPLVQWHPTIINMTGNYCRVSGLIIQDQPTYGIWANGNYATIENNTIWGGLSAHGVGTVLMAIFTGDLLADRTGSIVRNNKITRSGGNTACYSGVFNTTANSVITGNVFENLLEHGVYNYGPGTIISNNQVVDNIGGMIAAAIQSFAIDITVIGNTLNGTFNQIAIQKCSGARIEGNYCGSITLRSFIGVSSSEVLTGIVVDGNVIDAPASYWPIDAQFDQPFKGLRITNNATTGGAAASGQTRGAIVVYVNDTSAAVGTDLVVSGNSMSSCTGYAMLLRKVDGFICSQNQTTDANGDSADNVAWRYFSCTNGLVENNIFRDTRGGSAKTSIMVYAANGGSDLNTLINAFNNDGIGLLASANPLLVMPSGSAKRGNTLNSVSNIGSFTVSNATNANVSTGALRNGSGATVLLTAINADGATLQSGAHALYATAGTAQFNWATADGGATGGTTAQYEYEILQ